MSFELFKSENAQIEEGMKRLEEGDASFEDYTRLLKNYKKLFKQTKRLVHLSDRNEKELNIARAEAEAATVAKSSFLAAMSHEIRTPMNGVVGMIDLMCETKLDSDQRQMMGTVRESAFSLLQIINDILDFSKIEAGKLTLEAIPLSIRFLVEGVAETLVPQAKKKGLQIDLFTDPEIPDWILGDPVRIRQILFNLCGNAIKFTESSADKTGKVTIRADKEVEGIRLSIADNGIGMSKEAVERLFQPFTQAEESTTRRFGGTGLGLSICKNLTDLMDGRIQVESTEGEGSTFSVVLPCNVAEEPEGTPTTPDLSGLYVLISIEDKTILDHAREYLKAAGIELEVADHILEVEMAAEEAAGNERPFDLILVDNPDAIDMIEMSLQSNPALQRLKVAPLKTTPFKQSAFLQIIGVAMDLIQEKDEENRGQVAKVQTLEEAAALGELILIAEDNITNQDVITRQLKQLGFAAEVANNGLEALEMWNPQRHALLLTDCHMPEMDGYQLAGAIRDKEEGDERFPIIAITANALAGEAEVCLKAGMDDYLTKPLEMDKLRKALARWMPARQGRDTLTTVGKISAEPEKQTVALLPATPREDSPINPEALTEIFGDDPEIHTEILKEFVPPATSNVGEIFEALAKKSSDGVGAAAHKLKSSARSVGAYELADLCQVLETAGKKGDWQTIEKEIPSLQPIMDQVNAYIGDL